jgi:hypothetical protein
VTRIITANGEPFEDLEDLVFHNEPIQESEFSEDKEDYEEHLEIRNVGSLLYHDGYKTLLIWANREVVRTTKNRSNFKCRSDKDIDKGQILDREMEDAVSFRDKLQQSVEESANVPKPV